MSAEIDQADYECCNNEQTATFPFWSVLGVFSVAVH